VKGIESLLESEQGCGTRPPSRPQLPLDLLPSP